MKSRTICDSVTLQLGKSTLQMSNHSSLNALSLSFNIEKTISQKKVGRTPQQSQFKELCFFIASCSMEHIYIYICQFSITFPMAVWIIQKFVNFVPGQSPFFSFVMSLRGKLPGRNHQSWESWTKILISRAFRGRVGCSTCSHGAV